MVNHSQRECWNCKINLNYNDLFCSDCNSLQPLYSDNYFSFFDIEQSLEINKKDLENKYFSLMLKLHPDAYINKSDKERAIVREISPYLNKAYEILKNQTTRIAYILELNKIDLADDKEIKADHALLEEIYKIRESIDSSNSYRSLQEIRENILFEREKAIKNLCSMIEQKEFEKAHKSYYRLNFFDKCFTEIENKIKRFEDEIY